MDLFLWCKYGYAGSFEECISILNKFIYVYSWELRASERRVFLIKGVCYTSSHLHIFTSSHLLIFTSTHIIFTSSHLHIPSSHVHIFSSSHFQIYTYHLHIFTSYPHIFTSYLSLSFPLSLGLSPSFFSFLRPRAVPTRRYEMTIILYEMRFDG